MQYTPQSSPYLFGGTRPWTPSSWTSTDDRVRGGASHSYLTIHEAPNTATFHGTLDITALGGAGFASQRTTTTSHVWDLTPYDGLELSVPKSDGKKYTLTLKDELLPRRPDGRERSGLVWEYDFRVPKGGDKLRVPWGEFRPTYRGREVSGVKPLDLGGVRRVGIMVRSFFGEQEGEFELVVESIKGFKKEEGEGESEGRYRDDPEDLGEDEYEFDEKVWDERHTKGLGWFSCCGLF
ncbi:CIA30-domain-containing protein [Aspergillus heteromorphus CBS 117.55]|uniref:CIA30-domain-containing protein n=1 Tax=Aspergillus heteromorphus CBS 117.55 TaxID=1448321 RepID=A0A317X2E6_9EURO|nr:CIA30-domain-containing protein [Aspergillus heteromorphus CBS 117.55]PWY92321.1 CIA30-domain-containing protein [Aspergillus heteromorphus CBS 117.55]